MKTTLRLLVAAFVLVGFNLSAATLYVSLESTNPTAPFATWSTAATNIQDAVDAAKAGDTVLVTNGVYTTGIRDSSFGGPSRVVVTNAITLQSVNGPGATFIHGGLIEWEGYQINCIFLGNNAVINGFTLTNGYGAFAGGIYSEQFGVTTNCVISGNLASTFRGAGIGGGAYGGTLYNCVLSANRATGPWGGSRGGGAAYSTLYNCTLSGNSASYGGGAGSCSLYNCTLTANSGGGAEGSILYNCMVESNSGGGAEGSILYNCLVTDNQRGSDGQFFNCTVIGNGGGVSGTALNSIIYYNSSGNYSEETILSYCCTSPLPTNGIGNIIGPPLFRDSGGEDFRLWEGSPCIDAGTNLLGLTFSYWTGAYDPNTGEQIMAVGHITDTDVLGNTRFIDGNGDGIVAWDIGAYEFNSFKAPRFTSLPQIAADGWKLNVTGEPNKWMRVQKSSNSKDWENIWSGFMAADGVCQVTDSDMGQKIMFYRAAVVP